jgi:hypothetical protein
MLNYLLAMLLVVALVPGIDGSEPRKRLKDPNPQERLKAALDLSRQLDEDAISVLIELLAVLPAAQRRQAELALQGIAEEWAPNPKLAGDDEISRRILRDAWTGWWKNTDGPALLAAFQKRTVSPAQTAKVLTHIRELGDAKYAIRQRASTELVALGPPIVPLLRHSLPGTSVEQSRRIEQCLEQIAVARNADALPCIAVRLLAMRKPAGATETLLAYFPFTDDEEMKWEVAKTLHGLVRPGDKPDASLVKALSDVLPARRALAGEVLAATPDAEVRAAVRKLLGDPEPSVRLRVAVALACAADRKAVPVLIELLAESPADQAWQADEILRTIAGANAPSIPPADDAASRQKQRDAWRAWHVAHGDKVKLAPQPIPPPLLGFTTISAFSPPPDRTRSLVLEVDRHGKVRWQFTAHYPLDLRVLPNRRVLLCEGEALRVTERDFKGNIHWQVNTPTMPYNVQRLPNGNTFVAARMRLLEYDPAGKLIFDRPIEELIGGVKLPDGQIVYLDAKGKCFRLDTAGKIVKTFESGQGADTGCVLDLTRRGTLLVTQPQRGENFDLEGKSLWRIPGNAPGILTDIRNAHFLAAGFAQSAVIELDRTGKTVWRYETPGYHPFIARKR